MEWIEGKQSTPTDAADKLVTDGRVVAIGWFSEIARRWYVSGSPIQPAVTYWMLLPEPPAEQEQRT